MNATDNLQKWPGIPPICEPKIFFKNQAISLLCPYGAQTPFQISEKTNERFLEISKDRTKDEY